MNLMMRKMKLLEESMKAREKFARLEDITISPIDRDLQERAAKILEKIQITTLI